MTPPWGINWQRYHADRQDMPHIAKMGYASFTIYEWMWNNRDFCNELVSVARKDAIFLNRDHPKSEEKDDQWRNDPKGKGRAHADDWAQKVKEGRVFTPLDRTYFLGLNEPNSEMFQREIDAYNEAYCRRMAEHGLRAAAYSFGVGHPSTVDLRSDTQPDWSWYAASAAAVLEGHHLAAFHEYGAPSNYGWEYWCNRVSYCPYPFDAVFDECGIDHGVLKSGYLYGWAIALKGEEYVHWLDGFQVGMAQRAHTRKVKIRGYNIFSFDHGDSENKDWHSFDIRPLRSLLEAFQWSEPSDPNASTPTTPPVDTHLPSVGTGTPSTPAYVIVKAGANLRAAPITGQVITAIPYGEEIRILGVMDTSGWLKVRYRDQEGYMAASLVGLVAPEPLPAPGAGPEPTPQPTGDNWTRSRAFVRKWEGGYSDNPEDHGNWTGGQKGVGELKGTKYGISAASYPQLDIRNLTMAEADAIYFRDYWQASNAASYPWPYCLLAFDTAVLHGVETSRKWQKEVGDSPLAFAAKRLRVYTKLDNWDEFGAGWTNRVADLLEEASKP